MLKEKIIDMFKSVADKKDNGGTYIIQDIYFGGIADTLLAMFEQEKKEVARKILNDLKGLLEGYVHTEDNISLYEYYCKKYEMR